MRSSRLRLLGAGAGLILIAAGWLQLRSSTTDAPPMSPQRAQHAVAADTAIGGGTGSSPLAPPTRLRIDRVHVSAPIVPIRLQPDATLLPPDPPSRVGWWQDSVLPGSSVGTTVITGHVDSATYGPGALFALRTVKAGDVVTLSLSSGQTLRYRVAAIAEYHKTELPYAQVLSQSVSPSRLVIITCGGAFDAATRHYRDNLVVYAARIG